VKSERDEACLLSSILCRKTWLATHRKALNYHIETEDGNTVHTEEARSGTDRVELANHR
jgi:hypothetical protein